MAVKMVFSDMDDTFLDASKSIVPKNRQMLDTLYERGIEFVPCTGRNVNNLPAELVAHPAVNYAICCNAALIVSAREGHVGEVLSETVIPKDVVLRLYNQVRDLSVTFDLFADSLVYTERARFGFIDEVALSDGDKAFIKAGRTVYDGTVDQVLDKIGSVCRVNVFFHNEAERNACWAAVDAIPELRRSASLPCNIEITAQEAHKGFGVAWLCDHLGIDVADTVGFGDNDNDVTMLEAVGDGVAMANALPQCKAVADHVTLSCEEAGVAAYMEKLLAE